MKVYQPGAVVHLHEDQINPYQVGRPFVIIGSTSYGYLVAPMTTKMRHNETSVFIPKSRTNKQERDSMVKVGAMMMVLRKSVVRELGELTYDQTALIIDKAVMVTADALNMEVRHA